MKRIEEDEAISGALEALARVFARRMNGKKKPKSASEKPKGEEPDYLKPLLDDEFGGSRGKASPSRGARSPEGRVAPGRSAEPGPKKD